MDLKDIKCFLAVYEEKSINKASKRLFITPQGLSKIIMNLENELDTVLFDRTAKGVYTTESAEFLYEKSHSMMKYYNEIKTGIQQINNKDKILRIACARGVLNALSFQIILDFIKENQHIEVQWSELSNEDVKESIISYKQDVGIVVGKSNLDEVIERHISSRNVMLLIYEGHSLYHNDEIEIEKLRGEKIITLNEEFQVYHEFKRICMESGFVQNIVGKTADSSFLYKLCKLKVGIGVIIDFSTEDFNLSGAKIIPLKEKITWDIYHIYNRQNSASPIIYSFLDFIEKNLK